MPTFRRLSTAGFTLIELLVVLSVIGLVAAMMVPRLGARPDAIARGEAKALVASAVAEARRAAFRSGAVQRVDIASLIEGGEIASAVPQARAPAGSILVFPDGSTSGGIVSKEGRLLADVDWLTGQVRDGA